MKTFLVSAFLVFVVSCVSAQDPWQKLAERGNVRPETLSRQKLFGTSVMPSEHHPLSPPPTGEFLESLSYFAGNFPEGAAVGDFNGDGKLDIAIANQTPAGVSILLGNGDGTFQAPVGYQTGGGFYTITVGDFNGDGTPDLVLPLVGGSPMISVLLGNGDGSFRAPVLYATGFQPYYAAVGDFNKDGNLDIAVANFCGDGSSCYNGYPGTVSILLGNGDGTFQEHVDYQAGYLPDWVAVGDFNRDGKLDLVVANQEGAGGNQSPGTVSVLLGNGDGTFKKSVDYTTGYTTCVSVGDLNGDGFLDLIVADSANQIATVSVLLGNGDGTFRPPVYYRTGLGTAYVSVADLNGDGKLDLTLADLTGNAVSVLLGKGDGTFDDFVEYGASYTSFDAVIGDFNQDGRPDIVSTNYMDNTVSVLLGNGDGTFRARADYQLPPAALPNAIAAGDLNGDGLPDLVTANSYVNSVSVLLNRKGTFVKHAEYPVGNQPESVTLADFNHDGFVDLAVANSCGSGSSCGGGSVSILLGKGNGSFLPRVDYPTGSSPRSVAVGDFNRDGKPDLAVANFDSNTVSILFGNGDGTFTPHSEYATATAPVFVTSADFNGDGKLDLAVADYDVSSVSILLGNGDGTFQPQVEYAVAANPSCVRSADLNLDGILDLASSDQAGNVSVLLGRGDGTFTPAVNYGTGRLPSSVAVGDVNGDGNPDIVTANTWGGTVSVLLGNGDGTFQNNVDYLVGASPTSLALADYNSDGKLDIATANSGTVSILLNTAGTDIRLTSTPNPSHSGQLVRLLVTVRASVDGAGVPSGTVSFYDGPNKLGISKLAKGIASLNSSTLSVGRHTIRARYNGDSEFSPKSSSPIIQVVKP